MSVSKRIVRKRASTPARSRSARREARSPCDDLYSAKITLKNSIHAVIVELRVSGCWSPQVMRGFLFLVGFNETPPLGGCLITAEEASALTLGTAGCITGEVLRGDASIAGEGCNPKFQTDFNAWREHYEKTLFRYGGDDPRLGQSGPRPIGDVFQGATLRSDAWMEWRTLPRRASKSSRLTAGGAENRGCRRSVGRTSRRGLPQPVRGGLEGDQPG